MFGKYVQSNVWIKAIEKTCSFSDTSFRLFDVFFF